MNHKRRSRRVNDHGQREDHKTFRQSEKALIRGDHGHAPYGREHDLPEPNRRGKRSKKRPIEYCPAREGRKRHHYLEDEETREYFFPGYSWLPSGWRTYTYRYKLCVYCGDEKSVSRRRHWR